MKEHNVEQNTPEWFSARAGKPTASEFSNLVTSTGELSKSLDEYAITLANDLYAGEPLDRWGGNAHTERGHEFETEAVSYYELVNMCDTQIVGFVTDDDETFGCSPDRLVGDDGLLEIKCLSAKEHTKTILYYRKHGKVPTKYVQQIQGQILVCERKWSDIVFYHPKLPSLIIRHQQDQAMHSALLAAITKVCAERDAILAVLRSA